MLANENKNIGSGYVCVVWDKNSSFADFDYKVYERIMYYEMNAWPAKLIASHICCTPSFVLRMVKPILFALTDKKTRTRTSLHGVPDIDILGVLSGYGIIEDMLPTEMGGTIELKPSEWIANRRASEMEEI